MTGIWGAGVLTKLQELNVYDDIEAIYACSAGIFNGAYFLSRQMKLGSSIYYEDLLNGFIEIKNVVPGAIQRLWNGYVRRIDLKSMLNVMHLEVLIHAAENQKKLDIGRLKSQSVPLYAKLYNAREKIIEYQDVRTNDVISCLLSGCSLIPYYFPQPKNKWYIDAAIREPIGLEQLIKNHPNNKIIVIVNLEENRTFWHHLKNLIEGFIANAMYGGTLAECFLRKENDIRKSIEIAKTNPNVLLVNPRSGENVRTWTINATELKKAYNNGMKRASDIVSFINHK